MKLCAVKGGKWITGSSFGKTSSSFDRGSKCSYKTRKECDKSYNWNFIKKDIDPTIAVHELVFKNFSNM